MNLFPFLRADGCLPHRAISSANIEQNIRERLVKLLRRDAHLTPIPFSDSRQLRRAARYAATALSNSVRWQEHRQSSLHGYSHPHIASSYGFGHTAITNASPQNKTTTTQTRQLRITDSPERQRFGSS